MNSGSGMVVVLWLLLDGVRAWLIYYGCASAVCVRRYALRVSRCAQFVACARCAVSWRRFGRLREDGVLCVQRYRCAGVQALFYAFLRDANRATRVPRKEIGSDNGSRRWLTLLRG